MKASKKIELLLNVIETMMSYHGYSDGKKMDIRESIKKEFKKVEK